MSFRQQQTTVASETSIKTTLKGKINIVYRFLLFETNINVNKTKNSSGDEIANVNFLQRRRTRTCRGQRAPTPVELSS